MNTPTPRTDAATYPADCLGTELVTHRDCPRTLETELTTLTAERNQLLADVNEAHAATHHWCNRAERAEAELAAEREKSERYRLVTLKQEAKLVDAKMNGGAK